MSKGSDAPDVPEKTTTVTSNLPEYAEPYYRELLGRTVYESTRPYEAFPGQRIAEFDPFERQAMEGIAGVARSGAPAQMGMASEYAAQVGQGGPSGFGFAGGFDAPGYGPSRLTDPGVISSYMSPYQQLVTDIQKREAGRQSEMMGRDMGLDAAAAGSLGGYREAIMQGERERNLMQQMQDIQAQGDQQAYEQALGAFERDRRDRQFAAEYGLGAEEARVGAGLEGLGVDLSQMQNRLGAAELLGQLGGQEQAMALDRLTAMQTAGQIRREQEQRGLDMGYGDFMRQQAYPREQLAFFSNMLQGVPVQPGTTTATYGMQPSTAEKALGAGIAGVGLYRALQ